MKSNIKFFFIIILVALFSCVNMKSSKQRNLFLSQFFNNEVVHDQLFKYYKTNQIIIYDKKNLLVENSKTYGNGSKNIIIQTAKPINENHFIIYSFTLNKNLASLVLATSDLDYGIIYYLKRDPINDSWLIMNVIPKNSR